MWWHAACPCSAVPDGRLTAFLLAVALSGCGGQSGQPAGNTPVTSTTTTSAPAPPSLTATVTITPNGVTPKQVDILVGGRVTFVNSDVRVHDMLSNPLHVHNECPPMNLAGFLTPGQSRPTGVFEEARTCGFHDHTLEDNVAFHGTIVVR
jgi:plastocyanin